MLKRKLRMGMVGGGRGAFIGAVHRAAATMDGKIELVAGAFSSTSAKSKASGRELFLDPKRVYSSFEEMANTEASLPEDQRIDFVSIVTPNSTHFPIAKAFLNAGFHVVTDKPMTFDLKEARELRKIAKQSRKQFIVTYTYTGYPMVKEARQLVKSGKLGKIIKIVAEYPQGWLLDRLEKTGQKQASWRTDPKKAGASCCIGDIGTHAEYLGRYITGLQVDSLCAEFTTFIKGRPLEDDANVLVRYKGGAKGIIYSSQISAGDENNLNIRVYGTKAALEWYQENPTDLIVKYNDRPREVLKRGNGYLSAESQRFTRTPPGHPEAYIEAFANLYLEAARAISDQIEGKRAGTYDFPTVDDGLEGMAFIETTVKSARSSKRWTKMPKL